MRIALGQINTTIGDLAGNVDKMIATVRQAASRDVDLVVFPELSITGYPPQDLIERPSFVARSVEAVDRLVKESKSLEPAMIAGSIEPSEDGRRVRNLAIVIQKGKILAKQQKMLLPTYDVFDELRYFVPSEKEKMVHINGVPVALTICEDAWNDKYFWRHPLYDRDPVEELVKEGAKVLISINASPYNISKRAQRSRMFEALACRHGIPVVYVNSVGGNDQLVFDGSSFALSAEGGLIASAKSFEEDCPIVDLKKLTGDKNGNLEDENQAAYQALVVGTRDYVRKCGFKKVLIGLSGGIDSSLVAALAVCALGKENVIGVGMPGPYSSGHSVTDAREMAERLGIRFELISINGLYQEFVRTLAPVFAGAADDVTEENIQSRLRGNTLMALSNKWGALVLTTGNKSEMAVGYCTLYGDMCGGLAVICDVPKTLVYKLCRVANQLLGPVIPESVFTKPPSAELRADQKDTDSLPEYYVLDTILHAYIEESKPAADIAAEHNYPIDLVRDIARKVDRNEYKRQQAAPGIKLTSKAFGMGRRFPIAQRFTE